MNRYSSERQALLEAQAHVLSEALLGYSPEPAQPYYDTLTPKHERSIRNHRHLLIALLKERDGDHCYLCKQMLDPNHTAIDHIIPISHGGEEEPWNVALACDQCNFAKAATFVSFTVSSGTPCYHRH